MAADALQYFRIEAREILDGLGEGALELEKNGPQADLVARLMRLAHTLKGAARVVRQPQIAEAAHAAEDAMASLRSGEAQVGSVAAALLELVDRMRAAVVGLDKPAGSPAPQRTLPVVPAAEAVRVGLEAVDALLAAVGQTSAALGALGDRVLELERAERLAATIAGQWTGHGGGVGSQGGAVLRVVDDLRAALERTRRLLGTDAERVERHVGELHGLVSHLRLEPARGLLGSLDRACRDAALALGKQVTFEARGAEVRVDTNVLDAMREALAHVVRNAVAHGIEAPPQRIRCGKPPEGRVAIEIVREGTWVTFVCSDDGGGIDLAAVRKAAVRAGAVSEADASVLDLDACLQLITRPGVTTSEATTQIAGRGVGLDVVRAVVVGLRGTVQIGSRSGLGVRVCIRVPATLGAVEALILESPGARAALPIAVLGGVLRLVPSEVIPTSDGACIALQGGVVPLVALETVLGASPTDIRREGARQVAIVRADAGPVAIDAERVLPSSSLLVRPLPPGAVVEPVVAGAAIDAAGKPLPVLGADGLLLMAQRRGQLGVVQPPAPRLPVLVVDDSLTSRMLEQSILESAGYEVDLAVSGEDALVKAKARRYGLFVVDVEMPGLSGFEFVAQTRTPDDGPPVPAVLITSRDAPEDRERGRVAGAMAYIVKSEFDQARFLQIVRTQVG